MKTKNQLKFFSHRQIFVYILIPAGRCSDHSTTVEKFLIEKPLLEGQSTAMPGIITIYI